MAAVEIPDCARRSAAVNGGTSSPATRPDAALPEASIRGRGPQWPVYDADRLPDFRDKPPKDRFGLCPWGLYYIEVKTLA
jgi:hypothetical protein